MFATSIKKQCSDKYKAHQLVFSLFTNDIAEHGRDFCYLVNDENMLIYSAYRVNNDSNEMTFNKMSRHSFSIICSPVRGTYRDNEGRRHRMTPRKDIQDVFSWLERRFSDSANIINVSGKMLAPEAIIRPDGKKMVWPKWVLSGTIEVLQPKTFERIVCCGIGQGSGFGLGLLELGTAINEAS